MLCRAWLHLGHQLLSNLQLLEALRSTRGIVHLMMERFSLSLGITRSVNVKTVRVSIHESKDSFFFSVRVLHVVRILSFHEV